MNRIKIIVVGFLLVTFAACKPKCEVKGISVSELLMTNAEERNIDYCGILSLASSNDKSAIKQISLLEFENAVGYDHGIVLVELIEKIGENNFIVGIKKLTIGERNRVKSYLEVGIEYGETDGEHDLKKRFPKLFDVLTFPY
jgi:hypothetical protein